MLELLSLNNLRKQRKEKRREKRCPSILYMSNCGAKCRIDDDDEEMVIGGKEK